MFMVYSIVIGIGLGLLCGGRVGQLAELHLRWIPLAILAMIVQTILFAEPVWFALGRSVPVIYVLTMLLVLAVLLRNTRRLPALMVVAGGTIANLAAIIANGGFMPVTAAALGLPEPTQALYGGNSIFTADPALPLLVDRFALPDWLPFSTIFSVGDVLVAIGLVATMVIGMRPAPGGAGHEDGDTSPISSASAPGGISVSS